MLDRKNARLMDLINSQLARPTGKQGAEAFRPLGWMIRGIDTWESKQPQALEDLRAHAHQGVVDLYDFLVEQPATFSCSPEEFILGYRPAVEAAVPPEHVAALEAWYRGVGTVCGWLDVPPRRGPRRGDRRPLPAGGRARVDRCRERRAARPRGLEPDSRPPRLKRFVNPFVIRSIRSWAWLRFANSRCDREGVSSELVRGCVCGFVFRSPPSSPPSAPFCSPRPASPPTRPRTRSPTRTSTPPRRGSRRPLHKTPRGRSGTGSARPPTL